METKKNKFNNLKNNFKNIIKGDKVKNSVLAFQHMFAMLGATIVVPMIAGMSISVALISAGVGTIIFYFVTQKKVPVFLGSSFAFLPALIAIVSPSRATHGMYSPQWQAAMATAMVGVLIAGLIYVILSFLIKYIGVKRIKKLFPAEVVGPVIILIGMILVPKIFFNNIIGYIDSPIAGEKTALAWQSWTTAIITALTIVIVNAYAPKNSFLKVVPILLGFVVGYIYAAAIGLVSFKGVFSKDRIVIFQNISQELSFYKGFKLAKPASFGTAILMIAPMAVVTFMEHLGDISANSTVCNKDFMIDPGLNKTLLGDGLATMFGGFVGGPPNTTYGENTAVLAITKNYNPKNIFFAACIAVFFGIFSVFSDFLSTIPSPVIGGASIVLFGMISASGLRAIVEAKVDFSNSRNMIIVSIILALGLGLNSMSIIGDYMGLNGVNTEYIKRYKILAGDVEISPLAIATLVGIILNLVMPNKEEEKAQYTYINLDTSNSQDNDGVEVVEEVEQKNQTDEIIEEINDDNLN